jgi:hypothetical protein
MSRTPLPPDAVDAVLTDYFRSQLPKPWPAAPALATPAAPARRDPSRRARYSLAASVAVLAGACWLLAPATPRPGVTVQPGAGPDVLPGATARTPKDADKAKAKAAATTDPMHGFQPMAIPLP